MKFWKYIIYGLVAQLVRAPPCHGGGQGFEPLSGRLLNNFQLQLNIWGLSSAGRASALQAEGHRFEPYRPHLGGIAQLARAHGSYPWCREFKSPFRYWKRILQMQDSFFTWVVRKGLASGKNCRWWILSVRGICKWWILVVRGQWRVLLV